ncbi:hypothetical protein Micbo1qcDRAFT_192794 [Microdochium bolleyi]|uniref:R3H domain-containing protein n=1 Tax=Microdochium bolleyi TaxID=196109 RepID=A0A136JFI4_9PEZI|nr:hypothetical protein Micbo1qcDRAFT_192794 [Microdochium bolleyi]
MPFLQGGEGGEAEKEEEEVVVVGDEGAVVVVVHGDLPGEKLRNAGRKRRRRQQIARQGGPAEHGVNDHVNGASQQSQPPAHDRGGRGRGRGRGGGGRPPRRGGSNSVGGRQQARTTIGAVPRSFGGHLTTDAGSEAGDAGSLNADAVEFVPGQPVKAGGKKAQPKPKATPTRRMSRSTAPDLPTRIHEDITNGHYECVICTNEVLPNSRIWSCTICWTVTHGTCVGKWYTNQINQAKNAEDKSWRCPGCNSAMGAEEPAKYHCWCGKEPNPRSIPGLSPHSCGQTCSKPRGTCPHPCPLECHAGPCPPCLMMGPKQTCFCGKSTSTKRCGETDYVNGWSCHEMCGDLLPCGEHECRQECHAGLCGSCQVPVPSLCYCGRVAKDLPCDERGDKEESYNYGQAAQVDTPAEDDFLPENAFWGSFECEGVCGRTFDCGKHKCQKSCHPQDENEAHCPFSADIVTHCPCGKTPLSDILEKPRSSCEEPIPNCKKTCGRLLSCGHECDRACHEGACPPCFQRMSVTCRCGRTTTNTLCHQGDVCAPECMRICRAQLNCGRHEHGERCCPSEKRAMERVTARRKNKNVAPANEEVEAEHICIRVCGRELKCGSHRCQQMCHRGPCPSCPEAVFDEISCHCGQTVLYPPQPCGTRPPECRYDCTRSRPCGHPQVSHNCHNDDIDCPQCPFLVEKRCICGKQTLKNQPCWFQEPRCGKPCGKELKCGYHKCRKLCHRDGECEDVDIPGSHCSQPCMKSRKSCDHVDIEPCHAPYPCKEDRPCQAKTFVTCECQHRKQEVKCGATETNAWPSRIMLKCDDECLRMQRNARLADALNIDPSTHTDDHVPYSDTTLKLYRDSPQWAQTYEREYRVFASDAGEKRLRFKPMQSHQRAFLHSLAEDFGFDSESSDPEPHRHVCLFKTPRFVAAPPKTLSQCVRIRAATAQPDPASASSSTAANVSAEATAAAKLPWNALVLTSPRFGLTIEEVDKALKPDYAAHPTVTFQTSFLPSEEVVIRGSGPWLPTALENALSTLKTAATPKLKRLDLIKSAGGVFLCHADSSLNIMRREDASGPGGRDAGGWSSVVAGKSAARPRQVVSSGPVLKPLRSKFIALRKKPVEPEPVEDDWEAAADSMEGQGDGDGAVPAGQASATNDTETEVAEKSEDATA